MRIFFTNSPASGGVIAWTFLGLVLAAQAYYEEYDQDVLKV